MAKLGVLVARSIYEAEPELVKDWFEKNEFTGFSDLFLQVLSEYSTIEEDVFKELEKILNQNK